VPDWIGSHVRALETIGGVPRAVVPDQLKSGVTVACRYEPGIQRSFEELAQHYGTVILPARPAHPRDKAKVEAGVRVAQRWILGRIRNQTFFSLSELNARIRELVAELNDYRMRVYGASRRELFERLDRPALGALPKERFTYGEWKGVKVNIDYHVEFDHHYYSVPYTLLGAELDVRATRTTVEIYRGTERLTSHARSHERGRHTTKPEHMPKSHQKHLGVDALADRALGGEHRPANGEARRRDPRGAPAPGARLPLVPRHLATVEEVRRRAS
jgi:transposase